MAPPWTPLGELTPVGLRGPTSKERKRGGRGERDRRGEEGNGRDRLPFRKFWIRPWINALTITHYVTNVCSVYKKKLINAFVILPTFIVFNKPLIGNVENLCGIPGVIWNVPSSD